ncbi:MAG: hypothetical protein ACYTKD_15365 [Planctomycetota bacterium]|jgi:hypothetical protein
MVIPTDIQVSFVMAAIFADLGRQHILAEHKASPERARIAFGYVRTWGLLNAGLFLGPTIIVFFSGWPAWESQYWVPWAEDLAGSAFHSLLAGLYMIALMLAALLGSWLGYHWIVCGRVWRLRAAYLSVLAATVLVFLVRWPGPIVLGTYEQFQADPHALQHIWGDPWFFGMFSVLLVYCAMPLALVYIGLRRRRRESTGAA